MLVNIRKSLAIILSILVIVVLVYLLFEYGKESIIYFCVILFFIFVFVVIVASDFQILKIGYGKLYFWIQAPEIQQKEKETISGIAENLRIAYYSKEYYETHEKPNNKGIKLVKLEDNIAYLDSDKVFKDIRKGLEFYLRKRETFKHGRKKFETFSDPIAIGTVDEVSSLTKIKLKWLDNIEKNRDIIKGIKSGNLEGLNIYAFIKIEEEIKESERDKLEIAYDLIKDVMLSKYRW